MTNYKVERMTVADYDNYMCGGYNYHVDTFVVKADNKEDAVNKVKTDGYVVNKNYVKEVTEEQAEEIRKEMANRAKWLKEKAEQYAEQYEVIMKML